MSTRKLEFFYDYVSGYSYIVNSQVGKIEGADVHYRPMLLGAVMKASGNSPPGTVPAKWEYLTKDIQRWASHYDIPLRFNSIFPQNTMTALRVSIAAQKSGVFHELHQPLFDAMFVNNQNLGDDEVVAKIVSSAGLDAEALLADATSDAVKEELKNNTEEAVRRGVFGAPTFFVGDEMFFGNDRLDFVRAALAQKD